MNHITREYAGKKMKMFLNVLPLTNVNLLYFELLFNGQKLDGFSEDKMLQKFKF